MSYSNNFIDDLSKMRRILSISAETKKSSYQSSLPIPYASARYDTYTARVPIGSKVPDESVHKFPTDFVKVVYEENSENRFEEVELHVHPESVRVMGNYPSKEVLDIIKSYNKLSES